MKTAMPYAPSRFYSMWKLYKYPALFSSISTIYFFHEEIFYCLLTFREKWSKIFYRKYIQIIQVFSIILECFYNPLSGFIA